MPRVPRIEYSGATYHVLARGNRHEFIFEDDDAKSLFFCTLSEVAIKSGWLIHAYAIMGNHYHLLIETPDPNLVVGMSWLQSTFTMRYNLKKQQCGHVFAGRYKSILVQSDKGHYFSQLLKYINLNPTRAGIFPKEDSDFLHAHRWTSLYWMDKKTREIPAWFSTKYLYLLNGGKSDTQTRSIYLQQMKILALQEKTHEILNQVEASKRLNISLNRGWVYGDIEFREKMRGFSDCPVQAVMKESSEEISEYFFKVALDALEMSKDVFLGQKKTFPAKQALGMILKENTNLSRQAITKLLNMGHFSRAGSFINQGLKDKINGKETLATKLYTKIKESILYKKGKGSCANL